MNVIRVWYNQHVNFQKRWVELRFLTTWLRFCCNLAAPALQYSPYTSPEKVTRPANHNRLFRIRQRACMSPQIIISQNCTLDIPCNSKITQ